MDAQPLQEIDMIQYDDSEEVEDLGYTNEDIHNEQLQQQLDHIYQPVEDRSQGYERDHKPIEPEHDHNGGPNQIILQPTNPNGSHEDSADSRILTAQKAYPWLHPITIAESFQIYRKQLPQPTELHNFQEKLWHQGKLTKITLPK